MKKLLLIPLFLLSLAGCRDAAEFFHFTGTPTGNDGWQHEYNDTARDTWEAFRLVVRDNGEITWEDRDNMELRGVYKPHDSNARTGIEVKGKVYDKSTPEELRSKLIVHCWYANNANDRERQDEAREYCNSVFRVLKAWKGQDVDEKPTVDTTSEDPVGADEAIAFFKVTRAQAFEVAQAVVKQYGEVNQSEPEKGYLRGKKVNALEKETQEVRVSVYDRTEGESIRVKVSVRVNGADGKPLQELSKAYIAEIRAQLDKKFGSQE